MFTIDRNTIIYIFCPAGAVTGGPEALHQLCDAVNMQGGKAKMVYVDYGTEQIVRAGKPLPYKAYYTRSTTEVIDDARHIAIVPEIWPHLLGKYHRLQKGLWWLSVNYLRNPDIFEKKEFFHLYQSVYAGNFLQSKGIPVAFPLFDYLKIPFRKIELAGKRPQVCYNPKKGFEVTQKVIESMGNRDITFFALSGLSKKELAKALAESKVYIDFGDHPGKDRIPREAVMAGNIVITSRNGSAAFFEDLPIEAKYKLERDRITAICAAVEAAVAGYATAHTDFDYYRRVVRGQKREFFNQCRSVFLQGNYRFSRKLTGLLVFKLLPLNFLFLNAEMMKNKVIKMLSPSTKRRIRKLIGTHE